MKQLNISLILGIVLTFLFTTNYAHAQIVETATTKVAMDEIKSGLTDIVDDAMDRVDYTVAKAAIEALSIIDAWEEANSNLLNTAFNELDEATRNMFNSADALVQKTMDRVDNSLETAQDITNDFNQIAESMIIGKGRSFISRYSSPVLSPFISQDQVIEITGVNLDKSDLKAYLNDEFINVPIIGPTKATLSIPYAMIKAARENGEKLIIKVKHKTKDGNRLLFFPKYREVNRELIFRTLPETFASFTFNATRSFQKEERQNYRADAGRFEGRNRNITKMASPLTGGWKWDLRNGVDSRSQFRVVSTGGGEAARCQVVVWNQSNEHGLSIQARVDQIRQVSGLLPQVRWRDGYCHCGVEGPVYRFVDASENIPTQKGSLSWNDKQITFPADVKSWTLTLKLFNGEERIITNSDATELFEIIRGNNNIVIRPIEPRGL